MLPSYLIVLLGLIDAVLIAGFSIGFADAVVIED
jgi:hypothetical protein